MADDFRVEPVWIEAAVALAVHDRQLSEHGGPSGVRHKGGLESALARPRNQWEYGEDDLSTLAAAYGFGIARNHPFVDGNKRTAWVIARLFLHLNGVKLDYDDQDATHRVQLLAAGELTEDELAGWLRAHLAEA